MSAEVGSLFEYLDVSDGRWYRRGPACFTCQEPGLLGVIFQESDAEAPFEQCATCGSEIDVTHYGDRETGRVRILFPSDSEDLQENPYLNPLPRTTGGDFRQQFVDAGLHDIGNGKRLAMLFGERIRHTAGWGWLVYDGRRWRRDDRGTMERFSKATIHEMQACIEEGAWAEYETDKKDFARHTFASCSRGKVDAMLAMAASEPNIACGIEQFDQHPWLLNCKNGIVDLMSGALKPHEPDLYLTQLIPHDYTAPAVAPRWEQFLLEITLNDPAYVDYLHRAVGYTFTGETKEEKMFFAFGDGSNGKSKFFSAIRHVLGDYGTSLSFEALLNSRNGKPDQGFAHLPGKRFATATEAGDQRSWNQEAVTQVTGNDAVRGKVLYEDSFEFRPACKIWVAANNQPRIDDPGNAMWRRLAMLPFRAHFEGGAKDPDLEGKLRGEAEGILAWAVRGAARWYREGLRQEPGVMKDALDEYRTTNDLVGRWITESCVLDDKMTCSAKDLFDSYKAYCKDNNEREPTQTAFGTKLGKWKHGRLKKERSSGGKIRWAGIITKTLYEAEDAQARFDYTDRPYSPPPP